MRVPPPPPIEKRRQKEFESELLERARAWIPHWALSDDEADFGRALLKIAARFSSEVAERLDRGGEKMQRGFLDWLAVRGVAARPARMPVVLKLADNAPDPVLALAPVRMQADTEGTPVVFETETDVCLLPGQLQTVVACDGATDAFYLPPPGLNDLNPLEPLPTQWRLKSFAASGAKKLQLDPDTGLAPDMIVEAAEKQYKITEVEKDIVTIEPPLGEGLSKGQVVNKVTTLAPFDGAAHNWQQHALYLGDADLLNIEAEANIEIVGAKGIGSDVSWQYWAGDEKSWQPLTLADKQTSVGIVLKKPKGAIETGKVKEISARWIRAYKKTATGDPFRTDREIGLRINSSDCGKKLSCGDTEKTPSPAAEAMANTTPLVLDTPFFPLGKEPKQFDAFYLGSQEAFSKKKAEVQLCFQMADLSFATLSTMTVDQPAPGTSIVAGVGLDRFLHLLQFNPNSRSLTKFHDREPLQPPSPALFGAAASTPNPVVLDSQPPWHLPMWIETPFLFGRQLFIGMTAGNDVWLWCEFLNAPAFSGWILLGTLPPTAATGSPPPVDGLVYLEGAAPQIMALRGGKLYAHDTVAGTQWTPVDTLDTNDNVVTLSFIVPVLVDKGLGQLATSTSAGMVGVSDTKRLYSVATTGACTRLEDGFSIEFRPAAFQDSSSNRTVVGVDSSNAWRLKVFRDTAPTATEDIPSHNKVAGAIEVLLNNGDPYFLASTKDAPETSLVSWGPFGTSTTPSLVESGIPPEVGQVGGAPSALPHDVIIPGAHADLLVATLDLSQQKVESAEIKTGIVVPDSTPALAVNDVIARGVGGPSPETHLVTDSGLTQAGEVFYPIDSDFAIATGPLWGYRLADALSGTFANPDQFTLDATDHKTSQGSSLLIDGDFFKVESLGTVAPWVARISSPTSTPMPSPGVHGYIPPITSDGRVAPFMHLDSTNNDWDASLLQHIKLVFPGRTPSEQTGKAFSVLGNRPVIVVLAQPFTPSIAGTTATFIVGAAAGPWSRLLGDTSANPELSWEYWNGKGWWKLPIKSDATFNLKNSGALEFKIPDDIAATDWSGKADFWIRARLVGGDYGREKVTVTTTTNGKVSQQTVDRSSEGIRAPQVVKLHIFYRICEPGIPTYVLTQDSGSIRDQSDANRTGGAIVEAFVPLGVMLARLSRATTQAKTSAECLPECRCKSEHVVAAAASPTPAAVDNTPIPAETGRSIFLGFDQPLSQQPVNVLLLVEQEREHGKFAPMKVEALIGDRFVPIVANDTTRALGESGLLSMSFSVGPMSCELFGQSLYWLRLTAAATDSPADWKPTLRGAYLNAVWANAAETMTRELVGSSEGAPNLTLYLSRPPLLDNTLELRVKEPLGEEERTALVAQDKNSVLSSVQGLPGDWVLWKQVTDPNDEAPNARVYALDESNGEIRFGDGQHGAIPPIGTDSIVAFSYKRTEPGAPGSTDVPANAITARTQLGLVSPVPTVEAALAADQAAGGAPPEPAERVVRFGSARLRHRGRAVTARDLEDLALQSSPKIAQAHCLLLPNHVKLVVVMRGNNPAPNAAEIRELRRLLLAAAPATSLGATQVLRIQGPQVRSLRIGLTLMIADLDYSGEVARDAKQRIKDLFDVTTGGIAKDGWQLGASPRESDIAYVLSNAPRLEGIEDVQLVEIGSDRKEGAWPTSLGRADLAVLSEDPVHLDFTVVEVLA
jgi:hypothetical protein